MKAKVTRLEPPLDVGKILSVEDGERLQQAVTLIRSKSKQVSRVDAKWCIRCCQEFGEQQSDGYKLSTFATWPGSDWPGIVWIQDSDLQYVEKRAESPSVDLLRIRHIRDMCVAGVRPSREDAQYLVESIRSNEEFNSSGCFVLWNDAGEDRCWVQAATYYDCVKYWTGEEPEEVQLGDLQFNAPKRAARRKTKIDWEWMEKRGYHIINSERGKNLAAELRKDAKAMGKQVPGPGNNDLAALVRRLRAEHKKECVKSASGAPR